MIIFGKFILISYCCIDMFNIYKHLFNVYASFTSAAQLAFISWHTPSLTLAVDMGAIHQIRAMSTGLIAFQTVVSTRAFYNINDFYTLRNKLRWLSCSVFEPSDNQLVLFLNASSLKLQYVQNCIDSAILELCLMLFRSKTVFW